MARMRYDVPAFLKAYTEACEAGMTLTEIANLLGMTWTQVSQRVRTLERRGIPMPERKHGLKGKPGRPCPYKGMKRGPIRRRSSVVTAAAPEVEPRRWETFVITVGAS